MKFLRKSMFAFLIAIMLVQVLPAPASAAVNPTVSLSEKVAAPGETVNIDVVLTDNPGFVGMNLYITFDSQVLTLLEIVDAGKLGTSLHKPEKVSPYTLSWANDTATENFTANGTIVTLTFQVAESAPNGEYPVTVAYDYEDADIIDKDFNLISFATVDGSITVDDTIITEEPANPIEDFVYELSGTELVITGYEGTDPSVVIADVYTVGGVEYTVTEIGVEAFYENEVVESVVIPKTVTLIDEAAFYDCPNLLEVTVLGKNTQIGEVALGCYSVSRREDGLVEGFVLKAPLGAEAQTYAQSIGETIGVEETMQFVPLLKFSGAELELQSNLAIRYKVSEDLLDDYGYTEPFVVFQLGDKKVKVTNYTVENGSYIFVFRDIAPNQMNDTINAVLYASHGEELWHSEVREYSVATYCYTQLNKYSADAYAELRTLLVDLLNYGAVSQQFTGYNTDNLVSAALTETQKGWATQTDRSYTNIQTTKHETVENPTVAWKGGSLILTDAVVMRLRFAADNTEGLSFKVESGGSTWWIDEISTEDGLTYIYFNGLNAGQMSDAVFITAYQNGAAVSNTVRYSIESYASQKITDTATPYLSEIVDAMMKYGDSAYAYVH